MRIFSFIAFFTILWSPQTYAQFEPGDVKPIIGDALKDAFYGTTMDGIYTVSYTHLTLPTILLV